MRAWYIAPRTGLVPRHYPVERIVVGDEVRARTFDERVGRAAARDGADDTPRLCVTGMHASPHLVDCLCYMSGPGCVTLVEISGDIDDKDGDGDKICGRTRKTIALLDVAESEALWYDVRCRMTALALQIVYYDRGKQPPDWLLEELRQTGFAATSSASPALGRVLTFGARSTARCATWGLADLVASDDDTAKNIVDAFALDHLERVKPEAFELGRHVGVDWKAARRG